jgi:hypothetical protein
MLWFRFLNQAFAGLDVTMFCQLDTQQLVNHLRRWLKSMRTWQAGTDLAYVFPIAISM